jgi:two-component system chemotaxis response regulator CheB
MAKIKVLVVDDSAVIRQVLSEIITKDPSIELQAAVADPIFAMKRMEQHWPDVIVLDIEMPRMDGITFLRKIMSERPTPVVVCSTLTHGATETTMQAMAYGAVEIIAKPKVAAKDKLREESSQLLHAIKAASRANLKKLSNIKSIDSNKIAVEQKNTADVILKAAAKNPALNETTQRIVAIGTSTGGTQALEFILTNLPRLCPGIVIVQHMPEKFTAAFAARLNSISQLEVKEAENGDKILPGRALIAPGGRHVLVKRSGAQYFVEVVDGPLVSRHRPSVDVLFRSVSKSAGKNALGIIMTGMGDDGATGMKEMHDAGARTVAQDEASCVVYGMPHEAIKRGGVDDVKPLDRMPKIILEYAGIENIQRF